MPAIKGSTKFARILREDVRAITRGQPMRWVMVHELGLRHPQLSDDALAAALALAVDRSWLLVEGGHSVCLTDDGRRLASPS